MKGVKFYLKCIYNSLENENLKFHLRYINKSLEYRGLLNTMVVFGSAFFFDLKYRTKTHKPLNLNSLKIESENKKYGVQYEGVNSYIFNTIFQRLGSYGYKFDALRFIDFGCGKGKALMLASRFCSRLIGVEFSSELCLICKKNLDGFAKRKGKELNYKIINIDAAKYTIPNDAAVFFFYNPFFENVMNVVVDNIERSLELKQRQILIIYVNAAHKNIFEDRNYQLLFSLKQETAKFKIYDELGVYVFSNKQNVTS